MCKSFDVIVIGMGAMGSATCLELARRGCRVLGLEQFSIPNNLGSSHGESRIIRLNYYENPDYVPLLRRTYEGWDRLEAESGEKLHFKTGGLYMGEESCDFIQGTLISSRVHDLPHETWSREEVIKRYPQFNPPQSYMGIWESNAGFVLPEAAISAMTRLALNLGASVHGHEPVLGWDAQEGRVTVRTEQATYEAGQVIITSGAWAGQVLGEMGVKLEVTRQVLAWLWPKRPELFGPDRFPIWAIDDPNGFFFYGFPMQSGRVGLKVARHFYGPPISPDTIDRTPSEADKREIRDAIKQYLPDGDGDILSMGVCMYTNTPDAHFIIDRHPRHQEVLMATGFSGHGFKFAPVIGEIMADLALEGETKHPIDFLRLGRFDET
ncbi:MAG: N-methyl-L-tryptophan oxidase [Planctomycetota bacterium]|nr:N-methyl-L-tryptophan oxidase [Planctomycetota bacterium]